MTRIKANTKKSSVVHALLFLTLQNTNMQLSKPYCNFCRKEWPLPLGIRRNIREDKVPVVAGFDTKTGTAENDAIAEGIKRWLRDCWKRRRIPIYKNPICCHYSEYPDRRREAQAMAVVVMVRFPMWSDDSIRKPKEPRRVYTKRPRFSIKRRRGDWCWAF